MTSFRLVRVNRQMEILLFVIYRTYPQIMQSVSAQFKGIDFVLIPSIVQTVSGQLQNANLKRYSPIFQTLSGKSKTNETLQPSLRMRLIPN